MNKIEKEAYNYFSQSYTRLKDLNQPYRDNFDDYDEYYRGYRESSKYPMAYNYSFNKIISVIYTVLSRLMGQLYQSGDIVAIKPRSSNDVDRAKRIEGMLNFQMENLNGSDMQGGSYMIMFMWLLNSLIFGKGVVRAYWRKDESIIPKRYDLNIPVFEFDQYGNPYIVDKKHQELIIPEKQIVYDGPYVENIPIRNWFPDPEYRSIQKMPVVAHLHTKSLDWLKRMQDAGVYKNISGIGKLAEMIKGGAVDSEEFKMKAREIEGAHTFAEIESDRHTAENIDIVDLYGRYALEGPTIDLDRGVTLKGREKECICTIANYDTVIKLDRVKYGVKPFFDIGCHINPHRYWDIGFIELVKDIQEAYNNISNLRVQNAMMKVNTMIKVLIDSEVDPRSLVWKPFGVIPVENMEDVQVFDAPDLNSQIFREQIDFFDSIIQDMTGIYDYSKGVTPSRQENVGCFHESFQILTDKGWKTYDELDRTEKVMTLNHNTGEMEWQVPTSYFDREVSNYPSYEYKNGKIKFTVTEGHRFPVVGRPRDGFHRRIKKIEELTSGTDWKLPLTGDWNCEYVPYKQIGEYKIPINDWCAFLGLYLSEGWIQKYKRPDGYLRHRIVIRQTIEENKNKIRALLDQLPFNYCESKHGSFDICHKELWQELEPFGKTKEKYIPKEIKELPPEQLKILINWLIFSDGTTTKNRTHNDGYKRKEYREYYTTSKRFADDFQEILLKCGWTGRISVKKNTATSYNQNTVCYKISIKKEKFVTLAGKIKKIIKSGRVWCLSVPNSIFMVRSKEGMPFWTGNTIYSIQSMGEARMKVLLLTMDYMGIRPLLKYLMVLNVYNLPAGFEYRISGTDGGYEFSRVFGSDIHVDYDFEAKYTASEPALAKEYRTEQLLQYAQLWQRDPTINHYQFKRAILELMNFPQPDRFLKKPEEIAQEQAQEAMQQQVQQMGMMEYQDKVRREQNQLEVAKALLKG
jgi:hypothetical protein